MNLLTIWTLAAAIVGGIATETVRIAGHNIVKTVRHRRRQKRKSTELAVTKADRWADMQRQIGGAA